MTMSPFLRTMQESIDFQSRPRTDTLWNRRRQPETVRAVEAVLSKMTPDDRRALYEHGPLQKRRIPAPNPRLEDLGLTTPTGITFLGYATYWHLLETRPSNAIETIWAKAPG